MRGGDCAGSGYLYNGKAIPALRGKFVYNDITTGRITQRTVWRDVAALQDAGFPLVDEKADGRTRWKLLEHGLKGLSSSGLTIGELASLYEQNRVWRFRDETLCVLWSVEFPDASQIIQRILITSRARGAITTPVVIRPRRRRTLVLRTIAGAE